MNNNNLDQITMRSSKRKRSRFNLKHVNETSFSIGEIQPLMCKEVIPGSNSVLKINNVVRLAALLAPCFGSLKLHHNLMFVGMSDLTDKFAALLANQPVAFGGGYTGVPQYLPRIRRDVLSSLILIGSKCTCYWSDDATMDASGSVNLRSYHYSIDTTWQDGDPQSQILEATTPHPSTYQADALALFGLSSLSDVYTSNELWCSDLSAKDPNGHWQTAFKNYQGAGINLGRVMGWQHSFWVPSANFSPFTFLNNNTYSGNDTAAALRSTAFFNSVTMNLEDVTPDNCDYMILGDVVSGESTPTQRHLVFCFRLGDFGKRIRKLLLGLGYGIDFHDDSYVSLMKLFAVYKAWFDSFGITLYQGWETTNCAKCLQMYDSDYFYEFSDLFTQADSNPPDALTVQRRQDFVAFIADAADMWFTEEQDYVTAHMRTAAVSPNDNVPAWFSDHPNVQYMGSTINSQAISSEEVGNNLRTSWYAPNSGGHAFINSVIHTQLDAEVLKRLYKVTNRNTIAGRRIAQLLEAQGLGEYMKRCKSRFIGHWACDIEIFDVTATADTYKIATGGQEKGSALGEYVGKGVGEGVSKRMKYDTSEFGFLIDLGAVVPESGWMNSEDLAVRDIQKLDFYNPEYDGLGMEVSPKSIVASDNRSAALYSSTGDISLGFGFVPTYTKHKVTQNVANGDFTLASTRDGFLTFSLNKFVDLGSRISRLTSLGSTSSPVDKYRMYKMLDVKKIPLASPMYRYIARYPWMGQLHRIFANLGRDQVINQYDFYADYDIDDGEAVNSWFLINTPDNFIAHNVYLYDYYAPMLAIEDSYETHDDGNNGSTDMTIGKA